MSGRVGKTLLAGHTLWSEGKPYRQEGCNDCRRFPPPTWAHGVAGSGHGRCSCGAISPHLTSSTQRRKWHAEHKAAIREPKS